MREVVADHPLVPGHLHPVEIQPQTSEKPASAFDAWWCRIEHLPAVSGEIDFNPAMCVACPHDVIPTEVVILSGKKPVHFARRDAQRSSHDGHSRREILTMSGTRFEQKVR